MTDIDPDRSVTCAICGELADERRTVQCNPDQLSQAAPDAFERIGRAFVARRLFGAGEAHEACFTNTWEQHSQTDHQ